jgi:hypothetical protein
VGGLRFPTDACPFNILLFLFLVLPEYMELEYGDWTSSPEGTPELIALPTTGWRQALLQPWSTTMTKWGGIDN